MRGLILCLALLGCADNPAMLYTKQPQPNFSGINRNTLNAIADGCYRPYVGRCERHKVK